MSGSEHRVRWLADCVLRSFFLYDRTGAEYCEVFKMQRVKNFGIWFYTSVLFKGGLAIVGGIAAAVLAYMMLQLPAPLALLGIVSLFVFTWASIPLGSALSKAYYTKLPATNNELLAFVFLLVIVVITAGGLFLSASVFGDTVIQVSIGFTMMLFVVNIIAGTSIQASKGLPRPSYSPMINGVAFAFSVFFCFTAIAYIAVPLLRMAGNQPEAIVNIVLLVLVAFAAGVPFYLLGRYYPTLVKRASG